VLFSFLGYRPIWVAIFIITFDVYWVLKTIYFSVHLRASYKQMKKNIKINWKRKVEQQKDWQRVYHLIILPFYKEPLKVVRETIQAIVNSDYPRDKMIIVLATEERAGEEAKETARIIEKEFADKIL